MVVADDAAAAAAADDGDDDSDGGEVAKQSQQVNTNKVRQVMFRIHLFINRLTPEIKFAITCAYSEIVYKKS